MHRLPVTETYRLPSVNLPLQLLRNIAILLCSLRNFMSATAFGDHRMMIPNFSMYHPRGLQNGLTCGFPSSCTARRVLHFNTPNSGTEQSVCICIPKLPSKSSSESDRAAILVVQFTRALFQAFTTNHDKISFQLKLQASPS